MKNYNLVSFFITLTTCISVYAGNGDIGSANTALSLKSSNSNVKVVEAKRQAYGKCVEAVLNKAFEHHGAPGASEEKEMIASKYIGYVIANGGANYDFSGAPGNLRYQKQFDPLVTYTRKCAFANSFRMKEQMIAYIFLNQQYNFIYAGSGRTAEADSVVLADSVITTCDRNFPSNPKCGN